MLRLFVSLIERDSDMFVSFHALSLLVEPLQEHLAPKLLLGHIWLTESGFGSIVQMVLDSVKVYSIFESENSFIFGET